MHLGDLWHPVRPASPARIAATAIGFPAVATGLALAINRTSGVTAVSLYLLAVVLAAAAAGVWGGLLAAALSFAGFIFFFTAPRYTFRVAAVEDVVAAVVLLLVALVVGFLVARVLEERERTERRERDARLLGYLATKLLSGEQLPRVLDDFAQALLDPFDLIRCEVEAMLDGEELQRDRDPSVRSGTTGGGPGPKEIVPIAIGDTPFGIVRAVRRLRCPRVHGDGACPSGGDGQAGGARDRARAPGRAGARGAARRGDQPASRGAVLERDARSPDAARVDQGVGDQLAFGDGRARRGATARTAHDGARGDRSPQPRRGQPDGPGEDPGGRPGARPRAGRGRRAGADGRRADATATGERAGCVSRSAPICPTCSSTRCRSIRCSRTCWRTPRTILRRGARSSISAAPFRDVVQVRVADRGPGIDAGRARARVRGVLSW